MQEWGEKKENTAFLLQKCKKNNYVFAPKNLIYGILVVNVGKSQDTHFAFIKVGKIPRQGPQIQIQLQIQIQMKIQGGY